ncbi:hypothetical protein P8452_64554 [Trifolium repens]|nr:hypothetical protein P8452_64554 [Trifolium repens]
MAYVKHVLLAVFLLATLVTFPIKKVEAQNCGGQCSLLPCNEFTPCPCGCACFGVPVYLCLPGSYKDAVKIVGENLNLICIDDTECKNNASGNFCVRSLKSDLEYGVCANSISEAENLIFKIFSKSNSTKDFWEVST